MTAAISNLMTVVDTVISTIEGNATLMVFMCSGLVGVAVGVVKKLVGRY